MYLEKPRSFAETFQMPEFLEQERDQEMEQESTADSGICRTGM